MSVEYVTRAEFQSVIATLATRQDIEDLKQDFREELQKHPTKEDMHQAIAAAVDPLHHHFDVAVEQFKSEVRLLADMYLAVDKRQRKMMRYMKRRFEHQDERIDRVDADVYLLKQRAAGNGGGIPAGTVARGRRRTP